jgi:hypothetical protein
VLQSRRALFGSLESLLSATLDRTTLNDLLSRANVDSTDVLVLRQRPVEPQLRKVLPWLAAERPEVFNAYQQTSGSVADERGDVPGATHHRLLQPVTLHTVLWFDLALTDCYAHWRGKLLVAWPPPERSWWRRAHKNEIPIAAILEASVFDAAMPSWDETHGGLEGIGGKWGHSQQPLPQVARQDLAFGVSTMLHNSDLVRITQPPEGDRMSDQRPGILYVSIEERASTAFERPVVRPFEPHFPISVEPRAVVAVVPMALAQISETLAAVQFVKPAHRAPKLRDEAAGLVVEMASVHADRVVPGVHPHGEESDPASRDALEPRSLDA